MKPDKKIVVGLASIWAGGGHNALRDFIYEELLPNEAFELHSFTHSDKSYDQFNDAFLGKFPDFFDVIYNNIPNDYPAVSALNLVSECEQFIREKNPDIVIACNYGVSSAFALIKKTLKLNFVNVFAIPDYGRTGMAAFPAHYYLKPDYVLVFDDETRKGLIEEQNFPKNKILLSGYIARQTFRDMVLENSTKTRAQLIAETGLNIDANKITYLITGGAGGIIHKANPLLKQITNYQKTHPDFQDNYQFLVIAGKNVKYYKALEKKTLKKEWQNIIPVPWITHDVYAKLQMLSEAPILITIAPATINELLEAKCGPFIIHHSRKAQEQANIDFVVDNKFGMFMPKAKDVLACIIKGCTQSKKQDFLKRADNYKALRIKRKAHLAADIINLYDSSTRIKRKNDKKKLQFKLDITKLLTRDLVLIFLMVLPSSIIFAYAQYYKQKHALFQNKYVDAIYKGWEKFWNGDEE